ncbi:hypothetical protein BC826DRAFT_91985 [Russula brevipes]|nr:hypothetical protein BC826DRAFT_91985 [Russula brevipes]
MSDQSNRFAPPSRRVRDQRTQPLQNHRTQRIHPSKCLRPLKRLRLPRKPITSSALTRVGKPSSSSSQSPKRRNRSKSPTKPESPGKGKGKVPASKGKAVDEDGENDEEDDDEGMEEDDDDDDDDEDEDDEDDDDEEEDAMEEDEDEDEDENQERIDPGAILGRRTRGKKVDYSSAQAFERAGLPTE